MSVQDQSKDADALTAHNGRARKEPAAEERRLKNTND
jgi:hypothetical protein